MTIPTTTPPPAATDVVLVTYLRDRQAEHTHAARQARANVANLDDRIVKATAEITRLKALRERESAQIDKHGQVAKILEDHVKRLFPAAEEAHATIPARTPMPAPHPLAPFAEFTQTRVPPSDESTGPEQAFRPFVPPPARTSFLPSQQCGACLGPITTDEQNGIHHADDGTPAGAACERRTNL